MTELSWTFERPRSLVLTAVAGLVVAGAIVVRALAAGFSIDNRASDRVAGAVAPVPAASTDRAAIVAQLNSEYLRSIARGWYVPAASTDRAAIFAQLNSEYLREIARGW